jgi:AraC-like DNA-binding protein
VSEEKESIRFLRPSALPGVEIIQGDNVSRLFSVFHTCYEVSTVLKKAVASDWIYRGKHHQTASYGTSFMEPGETHHNTSISGPGNFRVVIISPEVVARAAVEVGYRGTPHFPHAQSFDRRLYRLFTRLHASVEGPATDLEQQSRFAEGLRLLLEGWMESRNVSVKPVGEPEAVRRMRSHLDEHYARNVSLQELAGVARLTRFHAIRVFTRQMGMPPHAYQVRRRIARARELLKRDFPIAQVAADVGFYDQSHLTDYFRRSLGVTPGAYRRRERGR